MPYERELLDLREYLFAKMPTRISELRSMALWSLYYGPFSAEHFAEENPERETEWPGYLSACEELANWASENISDFWVGDGCIVDKEPESWEDEDGDTVEVCPEDWCHFDERRVLQIVFRELVGNGL